MLLVLISFSFIKSSQAVCRFIFGCSINKLKPCLLVFQQDAVLFIQKWSEKDEYLEVLRSSGERIENSE